MKPLIRIVVAAVIVFSTAGCNSYGTELQFTGGRVSYTSNVQKKDAEALGQLMIREKVFEVQHPVDAQIDLVNRRYVARFVMKVGGENDYAQDLLFRSLAQRMSQEVFGKAPVDVALCDDSFKPLRTIAFQPPKPTLPVTVTFRKSIGGGSLVAQFTNTSSRVLAVKACLLNGTFRQFDVIALELPPGRRVEHGWLEGWKFASGETIFLEHSDYEPASFNVP